MQSVLTCGMQYKKMGHHNHQNKLQQQNNHVVEYEKQEMFSGPVPHPEIIERYEKIYPGAAKQIFEEYDRQVLHRHKLEASVVKTDNIKSILGVVFGFTLAMSALIGGIVVALIQGISLFSSGLSFSGLALLVLAFTTIRKKQEKE